MSDAQSLASTQQWSQWDRFWFSPQEPSRIELIRRLLACMAMLYFLSAWGDARFWFTEGGPFSNEQVAIFLQNAGLEGAATWIVSPLFLVNSAWAYQAYLVVGIVLALLVMVGRGGWYVPWLLWLCFVGWANRTMVLSGLAETALSLGLFATAIAPTGTSLSKRSEAAANAGGRHWRAGFSERLLAAQATVILLATFVTMLAGRVWFNGIGAYALAAPAPDRTIDLTQSVFATPMIYEALTHLMVIAIPVGLALCWSGHAGRLGRAVLIAWCLAVALIGSMWLYGIALAIMVFAIRPVAETKAAT